MWWDSQGNFNFVLKATINHVSRFPRLRAARPPNMSEPNSLLELNWMLRNQDSSLKLFYFLFKKNVSHLEGFWPGEHSSISKEYRCHKTALRALFNRPSIFFILFCELRLQWLGELGVTDRIHPLLPGGRSPDLRRFWHKQLSHPEQRFSLKCHRQPHPCGWCLKRTL